MNTLLVEQQVEVEEMIRIGVIFWCKGRRCSLRRWLAKGRKEGPEREIGGVRVKVELS